VRFDANLPSSALQQIPELAQAAERLGFDGLWTAETQHDPFLPLALAAEHTRRIQIGTAVAIGFARSPATLAYTAWDLAEASHGRFILGLGTQVRAHIERRFGMTWPASPVAKLRELVGAVRAFWSAWQHGERLQFRGEYFKLSLMTPFFNPGPINHPDIPIYLSGVNTGLARLAGEIADGYHAHPLHSARHLREVVRPALAEGAARAGRSARDIVLSTTAFVVTSPAEADLVRFQIAFYASTPTYRAVMALHGWGDVADELSRLSRHKAWDQMTPLITDEMLHEFAVVAEPAEAAAGLRRRYAGLVDRLTLYLPFSPGLQDDFWQQVASELRTA